MEKDKKEIEELIKRVNKLSKESAKLFNKETYTFLNNDHSNTLIHVDSPTRLEVINKTGRVYVNNNCNFELSYQDGGRTLKIFVK
jgi:hypothetical protein